MRRAVHNTEAELPVTTAVPLRLPAKQKAVFREILYLFERKQLPYAVSGGFALQQHTGICRFTKDLDVFLTPADASRALRFLSEEGFDCEVCDPIWLAKAHRDGFFVDLITGMSNGVISVDASWIEHSRPATIVGVNTRVIAPEDLLASKLFVTRRERFDGSDIAHIIYASRGRLEWGRVLELAGEHWELVLWHLVLFRYVYPGQSHCVPQTLWEDLLSRFGKELRSRRSGSKFRGSLIDNKMFAIDAKDWGMKDMAAEYQRKRPKIQVRQRTGR